MYDIIIIGAGPAGLTAAVYALRAGKTVLVVEQSNFGGQITFSPKVENIPGFVAVSGNEFAEKLVEQAIELGAEFENSKVIGIKNAAESVKTVVTQDSELEAKSVVIATGAKHRLTGAKGEDKFIGEGVSFCAVCDGAFYKNMNVAVIGGGNSALQEAVLLSEIAKKVTVIQNLAYLTGEKKLVEQLEAKNNVEFVFNSVVESFNGDESLSGISVKNTTNGEITDIPLDGVFVAIGLVPQNEPFADVVLLDSRGYAVSGEECKSQTNGVFVAGDCRTKQIRQVTTAAADGAVAALAACEYIDSQK